MIRLEKVKKKFNGTKVIENLSLEIKEGEFISLIGPSGCGKTTILKLIAGLIEPDNGSITKISNSSIVFQDPILQPWRTLKKNIELPLEIKNTKANVKKIIDLVHLKGFENHYPNQLSGGMQQRVAVARALITKPKVLLMDEPFGALDEITRTKLNEELKKICKKLNLTVLFITHSINEAISMSDKIVVLFQRPCKIKKIIRVDKKTDAKWIRKILAK